ncbi:MAG: hypothetical protein D6681_03015 [Calditrichaeota bacterium]|nr:MAG: hypothetical protein D6681_03015 [Calditrichota bacterium]
MAKKKKSKKRMQKKRQEKALKRRTQKKQLKKKMPRRTPGMPGAGMKLPPGVSSQQAQQLMVFIQPLMPLMENFSPEEVEGMLVMFQNLFLAFSQKDPDTREEELERNVQPLYELLPDPHPPFDVAMEIMLKRHIYLFPELHSEEERNRYAPEELESAMAIQSFEQLLPGEMEPESEKVMLTLKDLVRPELDQVLVKTAILGDEHLRHLPDLFEAIHSEYDQIDFLEEENPILRRVMEFQEKLLQGFELALKTVETLSPDARRLHVQNVRPLLEPFLREYHSASVFSLNEEHLEEYVLSYYLNKAEVHPEARQLLIHSLDVFIDFLKIMRFIESSTPFHQVLRDVEEEYYEMLGEEEESYSREEEDARE